MLFITMTYLQVNNNTVSVNIKQTIIETWSQFTFLYLPTLLYHQSSIINTALRTSAKR